MGLVAGSALAIPPITLRGLTGYWSTYAGNAQHWANSLAPAQKLERIIWDTTIDENPQYTGGGSLLTHYGSALITRLNTVVFPVKTNASTSFRVEGRRGTDGVLLWSENTDYVLPPSSWIPMMGPSLCLFNSVVYPGAGGTILLRTNADSATSPVVRLCFYGLSNYTANKAWCDTNVKICTPLTADARGNIYFGYRVYNSSIPTGMPSGFTSGIAKVNVGGLGVWTSAANAAGVTGTYQPMMNCTPAISPDGTRVYIAVRPGSATSTNAFSGYLTCLNNQTLSRVSSVALKDSKNTANGSWMSDSSTSTPMVAVDSDVYYGVLENGPGSNIYRGYLLRFDKDLNRKASQGAFGWDDTPSLVPSSAVPSYTGTSPYLILCKYNQYASTGGDGVNKLAVLDPNDTAIDPYNGLACFKPILKVDGVTPDPEFNTSGFPNAVREWCINTAAIDVAGKCAIVNCEDGKAYRWDFTTNSLTQVVTLTPGIGEAYTSTIIGPTGICYFYNNAHMWAVGKN